jgi:hypothetical protein
MSSTDQFQDLFDRAISSVPSGASPSTQALYRRLHRRSIRTRLSTIGVSLLAIALSATALFVGLAPNSANAVTLYPYTHGSASTAQLAADRSVMNARLHAVGYANATVSISRGVLVVTNGPKELASPTSLLTSSPELLVRSVTCYAGRQSGPVATSPLPTTCSSPRYDMPTVSGISTPITEPDPALAAYATTTPARDAKAPNNWALLPVLPELNSGAGATQRYLVGPTLITLSSKVASTTVTRVPSSGGWIVNVHLNAAESQQWNRVAKQYFHRQLAVDLNGVIVEAPLIEPNNSTFSSFDGQMQLVAVSKTDAYDLAAALTSGPLAVPLVAQSSRPATSTEKASSLSSPVCQASNITLSIGATYKGGASYPAGTLLTAITFTNHGPSCHLPMGGPIARAVRGTYNGGATKVSQLSVPVPSTDKRLELNEGSQDQALIEVRGLPSAVLHATTCAPQSAAGFVVEGYAKPLGASHYFARHLANVCFYAGSGGIVTNFGLAWVGTNS